MQSFRDAATLLVLVLVLLTVRVETNEPSTGASVLADPAEQEIALATPPVRQFESIVLPAELPFDVRELRGAADRIDAHASTDPDRTVVVHVGDSAWVLSFDEETVDRIDASDRAEHEIKPRSAPRPAPATPCAAKLARLTS